MGTLYIVATPIGNLEDMSPRAVRVLTEVALIAAEDTRHSAVLLQHFGIRTPMVALHDYNEPEQVQALMPSLQAGRSVALISDAGTPLVSDPGFKLVRAARAAGIAVVPVPGACAAIVALSAAGLPTDRFVFQGFPPPKSAARRSFFEQDKIETRTVVYYESPHRIEECLADLVAVFGGERQAVLARELTKKFETIHADTLAGLVTWLAQEENRRRGEFVVLIHGAEPTRADLLAPEVERVLRILLAQLPLKQAAQLAAEITGIKKNALYDRALTLAQRAKTTSR